MINRGKLKRDIEKGVYEGRLGFEISHDGELPDRYGKENDLWGNVRIRKDYKDWKENAINLDAYAFKSKSGHAYLKDNIVHFGAHSNELILLRKKNLKAQIKREISGRY